MKTKLNLKKETVEVLQSVAVYGGTKTNTTLISGGIESECYCIFLSKQLTECECVHSRELICYTCAGTCAPACQTRDCQVSADCIKDTKESVELCKYPETDLPIKHM